MTDLTALIREGRELLEKAKDAHSSEFGLQLSRLSTVVALLLDRIEQLSHVAAECDALNRIRNEKVDTLRAENEKMRTALEAIVKREWPNGALKDFARAALPERKP